MTEVLKFTILDAGLVETALISRPGIEACGLVPYFNKLVHDTLPVLIDSGMLEPEMIGAMIARMLKDSCAERRPERHGHDHYYRGFGR